MAARFAPEKARTGPLDPLGPVSGQGTAMTRALLPVRREEQRLLRAGEARGALEKKAAEVVIGAAPPAPRASAPGVEEGAARIGRRIGGRIGGDDEQVPEEEVAVHEAEPVERRQ